MQLRASSVRGERPRCPANRSHRVHAHGSYRRYRDANSHQCVQIPRWLCVVCARTLSVLPESMLPYRFLGVALLQSGLDARFDSGTDPPGMSEAERGCLRRAFGGFVQRIPSLCELLGQMVDAIHPEAAVLWQGLRQRHGPLTEILGFLAQEFKTSLLGDYRCLKPWTGKG